MKTNTDQIIGRQFSETGFPVTEKKRTLSSVIVSKFLEWIEDAPVRRIFYALLDVFLILGLATSLVSPEIALGAFIKIFSVGNFTVPKFIFAYLLVVYRKQIFRTFRDLRGKKNKSVDVIEGIPKNEILKLLFETKSFKVKDFRKKFGNDVRLHQRIARKLLEIGVLKRGANNSYVLNEEYSYEQVRDILADAKKSRDISSKIRIFRGGEAHVSNTEEIKESLQDVFKVTPIRRA